MHLDVDSDNVAGHPVLFVRGEIDLATLPRLFDSLTRAVTEHPGDVVIVDLDGVSSCDDAALGVLLGAAGRARRAGGDVVAVSSGEQLNSRFDITRFDRAVRVVSSVAEAIGVTSG